MATGITFKLLHIDLGTRQTRVWAAAPWHATSSCGTCRRASTRSGPTISWSSRPA